MVLEYESPHTTQLGRWGAFEHLELRAFDIHLDQIDIGGKTLEDLGKRDHLRTHDPRMPTGPR